MHSCLIIKAGLQIRWATSTGKTHSFFTHIWAISQRNVPIVPESHRSLFSSFLKLGKVDFQERPTLLLHFVNITELEMRRFVTEAAIGHCMVT